MIRAQPLLFYYFFNEFAKCNCLSGLINDLARAMWRWTEKKSSATFTTHKQKEMSLLMSLLDTKQMRSRTFTKAIKNTCRHKSLYIKTWFVCSNKFECLKNVETLFHNVSLRSARFIIETKQTNFSDQCQTKFLLPKSQNEFYNLLPIPSCTSSTKLK